MKNKGLSQGINKTNRNHRSDLKRKKNLPSSPIVVYSVKSQRNECLSTQSYQFKSLDITTEINCRFF